MIPTYEELSSRYDLEIRDGSLCLKDLVHPASLKYSEFSYLYELCEKLSLKSGYEIATAFGISALPVALSMKKRNGVLITMDCYLEETVNYCFGYVPKTLSLNQNSRGLKTVQKMIEDYELSEVLFPVVGTSPFDTLNVLEHTQSLDYVMIDAFHDDESTLADFLSVVSKINREKYAIVIHDPLTKYPSTREAILSNLPDALIFQPSNLLPPNGYGMTVITNQPL